MKITKLATVLLSLSVSSLAFADAPVVDLSQTEQVAQAQPTMTQPPAAPATTSMPDYSSLPMDQRINRLEQQQSNLAQMNLPSRIDQLQQQVNQLQGQLAEQTHALQTMQDQQKSFYQDLTQQLNQLKVNPVSTTGKVSTTSPAATTLAATATTSATEQTSYQNAFNLLAAKKYDEAIASFQDYLKQYPTGQFVANTHYWLGEIYFLQNKMPLSQTEFQTILNKYPKDQKVPDAMLKLAFINDNTGKHSEARQQLKEIIKRYPDTSAAQLASLRLKSG